MPEKNYPVKVIKGLAGNVDEEGFQSLQEWLAAEYPDICERFHHLNAMYEGESTGVKLERIGEKENEISALPGFLGERYTRLPYSKNDNY